MDSKTITVYLSLSLVFLHINHVLGVAIPSKILASEKGNNVLKARFTRDGMIEIEDMIISPDMFQVLYPATDHDRGKAPGATVHKRAALSSKSQLWPGGRIPYILSDYLLGDKQRIRRAMNEWEKHTCVKFVERTKETAYLLIRTIKHNGRPINRCSATVGYNGKETYLNLGLFCFSNKILLHELGHTLGLIHEHQHPNRDKYLTIHWSNIDPNQVKNFFTGNGVSDWGVSYDPRSIMHYKQTAFRKSDKCRSPCYTMESKNGTRLGGYRLSKKSDIPIINNMYCSKDSHLKRNSG